MFTIHVTTPDGRQYVYVNASERWLQFIRNATFIYGTYTHYSAEVNS